MAKATAAKRSTAKPAAKAAAKPAAKSAAKSAAKAAAKPALKASAKPAAKAAAKRPTASKRRSWTKDDVRELKSLAKQKLPTAKIARALKRTEGATRQKAYSLGVSLDSRR
jgi:hypothetical protein